MNHHAMPADRRHASAQRPVLAVEFTGLSAEADFNLLLGGLNPGTLIRIDPLDVNHVDDLNHCARSVADALPFKDVAAVVGSCTGAPLALEITAALRSRGTKVGLVTLVNPQRATKAHVLEAHREIIERLCPDTAIGPDPLPVHHEPDLSVLVPALYADLLERAARCAIELGVEPDEAPMFAEELCDRYRTWLSFLAGNARLQLPMIDVDLHLILDDTSTDDLWAPFAAMSPRITLFGTGATPALTSAEARVQMESVLGASPVVATQ